MERVGLNLAQQIRDIYQSSLRHADLRRLAARMPELTVEQLTQLVDELQTVRRRIRSRQNREAEVSKAMRSVLSSLRRSDRDF